MKRYIFQFFIYTLSFLISYNLDAQELATRIYKPQNNFFFFQSNLSVGSDPSEPTGKFGFANRGPRTQVTFEWFNLSKKRIQQGYSRFISINSSNVKFGLELVPLDGDNNMGLRLRLLDTWIKFDTKWDRTSFYIGSRNLPFGHNPKLDGNMAFLPNLTSFDLGISRDIGFHFKTPVAENVDLEFTLSAGGWLVGTPVAIEVATFGIDIDEQLEYEGNWLGTLRFGSPTFKKTEIGVSLLGGRLQRNKEKGTVTRVGRIGIDWIQKERELWKMVNQVSFGIDKPKKEPVYGIYSMLNSFEYFINDRMRAGVTNIIKHEDIELENGKHKRRGTLFLTLGYGFTRNRNVRFRINPFVEYFDTQDSATGGVLFQICTGCGLWK